ncbi:hypothetical protein, partial [Mesorhizobium sp. M2E.F.Ca.ET.209.01.1.1]|uniref:hypothetical protein n=1 Tax=Mesorhizobium sp. M2E.F.Ca.ET.209.01.1.1 TaxID=2500526 RepID=UPI001AEE280A
MTALPCPLLGADYRESGAQAAWKIATQCFWPGAGNIGKQIALLRKPSATRRREADKHASYPPGVQSMDERNTVMRSRLLALGLFSAA